MTALVTDSGRKMPARLAGSAVLAVQSDERLVALLRDGHERAFEAIVSRYRAALVRFCARILPDSRTEDAVQQTFINAHAALLAADVPPAQLKPWLYTVARNASLNMLRQNGWNYDQIPLDFDGVRRPEQVVEQRIELQQAVAAVGALPERQRDAIVMREFEGRSYEEIALALGTGGGAVRQLLNRARGTLRAAASAVMPPPLVARAASSLPTADGRRVAEVFGGIGAAGAAKVGATALVAGSLVIGAVSAPLPLVGGHHAPRARVVAAAAAQPARDKRATGSATAAALAIPAAGSRHGSEGLVFHAENHGGSRGRGQHSPGAVTHHQRGSTRGPGEDRSGGSRGGSGEHNSGSNGSDDSSGSGSTRHASNDSPTSGSHDGSGTSGSSDRSGSGSSGSGDSGTSGSDDLTRLSSSDGGSSTLPTSDSLTSGSGTSGSGTSGSSDSGTSGSSSSGSGTSGSGTSGSGTSGSGDSATSGSSTSGSDDGH